MARQISFPIFLHRPFQSEAEAIADGERDALERVAAGEEACRIYVCTDNGAWLHASTVKAPREILRLGRPHAPGECSDCASEQQA